MLAVLKFGGSSVANAKRIEIVAEIIGARHGQQEKLVVVLSAQGDTTDDLIEKVKEISDHPSRREMDMLLATGEQQSVSLMAIALQQKGYPAISLNAQQSGIETTAAYSNARIQAIDASRIEAELERGQIVLVTGFQGFNQWGDITTLGRGGSDTSAVALAARLQADVCEIYTDVDGIYTGDPRYVENAQKLEVIGYNAMLEMASLGAQVLHKRSVELAKKYHVRLVVRSSFNPGSGTRIEEDRQVEQVVISGIAVDKKIATVSIIGIEDVPGMAFKIFSVLAKVGINVDIILQSVGRDQTKDIVFTIAEADIEEAKDLLEKNLSFIQYQRIEFDRNVAKLSIVGAGLEANPGVASKTFEALYSHGINIKMISTSEIKISLIVDERYVETAANAIHSVFFK